MLWSKREDNCDGVLVQYYPCMELPLCGMRVCVCVFVCANVCVAIGFHVLLCFPATGSIIFSTHSLSYHCLPLSSLLLPSKSLKV